MSGNLSHQIGQRADRDVMRQILLASGALTNAFGEALGAPPFAGLSANSDIVVLTSLHLSGPQRTRDLREQTDLGRHDFTTRPDSAYHHLDAIRSALPTCRSRHATVPEAAPGTPNHYGRQP